MILILKKLRPGSVRVLGEATDKALASVVVETPGLKWSQKEIKAWRHEKGLWSLQKGQDAVRASAASVALQTPAQDSGQGQ